MTFSFPLPKEKRYYKKKNVYRLKGTAKKRFIVYLALPSKTKLPFIVEKLPPDFVWLLTARRVTVITLLVAFSTIFSDLKFTTLPSIALRYRPITIHLKTNTHCREVHIIFRGLSSGNKSRHKSRGKALHVNSDAEFANGCVFFPHVPVQTGTPRKR